MKKTWKYALVVVAILAVVLICEVYDRNTRSHGILVKTESDQLLYLQVEEPLEEWGYIVLTPEAKESLDLTMLNTGDRVRLRGNISVNELWPLRYQGVKGITVDARYDEESLQQVRAAVQRYEEAFGSSLGTIVYPE